MYSMIPKDTTLAKYKICMDDILRLEDPQAGIGKFSYNIDRIIYFLFQASSLTFTLLLTFEFVC